MDETQGPTTLPDPDWDAATRLMQTRISNCLRDNDAIPEPDYIPILRQCYQLIDIVRHEINNCQSRINLYRDMAESAQKSYEKWHRVAEINAAKVAELQSITDQLLIANKGKKLLRGKWIGTAYHGKNVFDDYECSVCGRCHPSHNGLQLGKYCPYCGSLMDLE